MQDWCISGKELYDLTIEEFHQKVPHDPDNIFWTHLELLRRLKVAAVQGELHDNEDYNDENSAQEMLQKTNRAIVGKQNTKPIRPLGM